MVSTEPSVVLMLSAAFAAGIRHSFEPDHMAAVSAFATRASSPWGAMRVAAEWGVGHAIVLVVATGLLARTLSSTAAWDMAELPVAGTLLYLGRGALRRRSPHEHAVEQDSTGWGALGVGGLHGLAGSGALVLGTAGALSATGGMVYALVVGLAALAGMMASATMIRLSAHRHRRLHRGLIRAADLACLAVGLELLYRMVRS